MTELLISCKIDGHEKQSSFDDLIYKLAEEKVEICELIRQIVTEQVRSLNARNDIQEQEKRKIINRQYLRQEDIEEQAKDGRIAVNEASQHTPDKQSPLIDPDKEAQSAVRAFKRGAYFVLINGKQVEPGDELSLTEQSKLVFLRLTPLVGG